MDLPEFPLNVGEFLEVLCGWDGPGGPCLRGGHARFYSDDIAAFDIEERGEIENTKSEIKEDGNLQEEEDE